MNDKNKELSGLSKEQLAQKMHQKNTEMLSGDGIEQLIAFNLENFAYRYLQKNEEEIKCQKEGKTLWVESLENNIIDALKTNHKELKSELIELCKKYPGPKSKEIEILSILGTEIINESKVRCFSTVSWDFPHFKDPKQSVTLTKDFSFEDPLDLRNIHAALLEELTDIFC